MYYESANVVLCLYIDNFRKSYFLQYSKIINTILSFVYQHVMVLHKIVTHCHNMRGTNVDAKKLKVYKSKITRIVH